MHFLFIVLGDIDIVASIMNIVNALAVFSVAASALAILRAGYIKIFSGDNYQHQSQFYSMITAAVIGLVVCLGAVTLNNLIFAQIVHTAPATPTPIVTPAP